MKNIIIIIVTIGFTFTKLSAQDTMYIHQNNGQIIKLAVSEIDSITFYNVVASFEGPELNVNFAYVVNGNTIGFTASLTNSTWITSINIETTYYFVGGTCEVYLPLAGAYNLSCGTLKDGIKYTSEEFTVTILDTDSEYFNTGMIKDLTGGINGNKKWILDIHTITDTVIDNAGNISINSKFGSYYFHNPLDFYGDDEAGAEGSEADWGPWGGSNIYDWGGVPEIGSILFNAVTGMATLNVAYGVYPDGDENLTVDGDGYYNANPTLMTGTFSGSFNMITNERDMDFCRSIDDPTLGTISLWESMLAEKYSYLGGLSKETATITFSDTVRFPMDKGRVGEGDFEDVDMQNVMIMHCSDSALIVRIKRTYEGLDGTGKKIPDACWQLYNYIVEGYTYIEEVPNTTNAHVVNSSITESDLVGTWRCADLTGEWVIWETGNTDGSYTAATEASTFASWGIANADAKYAAALKSTFEFNSDNTVTINDVTYVSGAEKTATYSTTYSINGGYITFADEITMTGFTGMIVLSGINIYAISTPATATVGSLWLGQNNGERKESKALQLIKQ